MTSLEWREVCKALLGHFMANEGTTYLHSKRDRESFSKEFGENSQQVLAMIREFEKENLHG